MVLLGCWRYLSYAIIEAHTVVRAYCQSELIWAQRRSVAFLSMTSSDFTEQHSWSFMLSDIANMMFVNRLFWMTHMHETYVLSEPYRHANRKDASRLLYRFITDLNLFPHFPFLCSAENWTKLELHINKEIKHLFAHVRKNSWKWELCFCTFARIYGGVERVKQLSTTLEETSEWHRGKGRQVNLNCHALSYWTLANSIYMNNKTLLEKVVLKFHYEFKL